MPLGTPALSEKVSAFCHGLDVDALRRGLERGECSQAEADKRGLSRVECHQILAQECAQAVAEGRGLGHIECSQAAERSRELFDLGARARALRHAHRSGRGADQGQAASHRRALGPAHGAAVPSAGDGEAGVAVPQVERAARSRAPIAMPPGCSSARP